MTSLAFSHSLAAVHPAPGRNRASCSSSQRLSLPWGTEEKDEASLSLLLESRRVTALFLSNSLILMAVVSVRRRASYGVLRMKLSEKSSRNLNFFLRLATSLSSSLALAEKPEDKTAG